MKTIMINNQISNNPYEETTIETSNANNSNAFDKFFSSSMKPGVISKKT